MTEKKNSEVQATEEDHTKGQRSIMVKIIKVIRKVRGQGTFCTYLMSLTLKWSGKGKGKAKAKGKGKAKAKGKAKGMAKGKAKDKGRASLIPKFHVFRFGLSNWLTLPQTRPEPIILLNLPIILF